MALALSAEPSHLFLGHVGIVESPALQFSNTIQAHSLPVRTSISHPSACLFDLPRGLRFETLEDAQIENERSELLLRQAQRTGRALALSLRGLSGGSSRMRSALLLALRQSVSALVHRRAIAGSLPGNIFINASSASLMLGGLPGLR
jgi:hypothetical protein